MRSVVILGAGRMGADIALAFGLNRWSVHVHEPDSGVRRSALRYWRGEADPDDEETRE